MDAFREIANYPTGNGVTIRLIVSGSGTVTQKSIERLIKHLELDKDDFPFENETKEILYEELDALSLEYKRDYGTARKSLNISDVVNNPMWMEK